MSSRKLRDYKNSNFPNSAAATMAANSSGDYDLTDGLSTLEKLLLRRLITHKGEFYHLPDYGLGLEVKGLFSGGRLIELRKRVEEEFEKEPEVKSARVSLSTVPSKGVLLIDAFVLTENDVEPKTVKLTLQPNIAE
jgi:hypothetical protein